MATELDGAARGTANGAAPARTRPDARLQQLGGSAAVAAAGITVLAWMRPDGPTWLLTAGAVLGGLLLPVAAALLAKAFVGDRAPLSWAKLGGIALIIYSCGWLVPHALAPLLPGGPAAMAVTGTWDAVRILGGAVAAAAIAARWPVRGFNRWSMLLVVAGDILSQSSWLAAAAGAQPLMTAMTLAWPLSVLALGLGHALSGRRRLRAEA